MEAADRAAHKVATHQRARLSFSKIARGARYVSCHEDPASLLRPTAEIQVGFEQVAEVARAVRVPVATALREL
jgi:hypothetical protein